MRVIQERMFEAVGSEETVKVDVRLVLATNEALAKRVEDAYGVPIAAVIPHSDDLMALASEGLFVLRYPDHPVTDLYRGIAARIDGAPA